MYGSDHRGLLRPRNIGEQQVTTLELFFDLVFVFAVTQLSHRLLDHLTVGSALETLLLLAAVWRAWVDTTWVTNWFDPDRTLVRLLLVALMLVSLVMSVAIPEAFSEGGSMFALAYVAIQAGRTAFVVLTLEWSSSLGRNFQRYLAWFAIPAVLWVAGGLLEGEARYVLWVLALVLEYTGPVAGFWTPGFGRSTTADWTVEGGHFAERCRLFVILALGESILVTGTTFGEIEASTATVSAFVVAFLGSVALWWLYFARSAEAARRAFSSSEDPGRIARSAYTYFHLPMIAGIIAVAAADELMVAHPGDRGTIASVALTLGGTALFFAGHALFKWAVFGMLAWPRVVAIAALIALIPVGFVVPALALGVAVTLIAAVLAAWDSLAYRGSMRSPRQAAKDEEVATVDDADYTDTDVERGLTVRSADSGETDAEDEDSGAVGAGEARGAPNIERGPGPTAS
jgi:low temperature requirement protein LtrA